MIATFYGNGMFNQDISSWNTSYITDMSYMFFHASKFDQPLDNWNTSKVTNMNSMFYGAKKFNQPLNNWNVSNVTHMGGMFKGATQFNQPLDNWNVSKVQSVDYCIQYIFSDSGITEGNYCKLFTGPYSSAWTKLRQQYYFGVSYTCP